MIKEGMTEKDFNNLSLYCQEHGVRTVAELKQVQQLCKEVGITNVDELADFFEVERLMDETLLDALKRYRLSLGDDYQLEEAAESGAQILGELDTILG